MTTIAMRPSYRREKQYVIDYVMGTYFGIDRYRVHELESAAGYVFTLPNGNRLELPDVFFARVAKKTYIDTRYIPENVRFVKNEFSPEGDIPVLFGDGVLKRHKRNNSTIMTCGIDIIASIFFMLSRWEEYTIDRRDRHGRVSCVDVLSHRAGFLHRPVVNEYCETMWRILRSLGMKNERRERAFRIVPTHDIDRIRYPVHFRSLAGDIVRRKSLSTFRKRLRIKMSRIEPYDTYNDTMDVCERNGVQSRFFFMNGGTSDYDRRYTVKDPFIKQRIQAIRNRGHVVGFHPSYSSFDDEGQWKKEKEDMEEELDMPVVHGRQHYLRFRVPDTWRVWNDNRMKEDQTVCYHDHEGFRCGTADSFPVFDLETKRVLNLQEIPLIVMDGTLGGYRNLELGEVEERLFFYREVCRKFKMPYTVLFHNDRLSELVHPDWSDLFKRLLRD